MDLFLFYELGLKSAGFYFQKYKKSFFLRKYKKFFNFRVRKFHFLNYKEFFSGWIFLFLELGPNSSSSWIIRKYMNLFNNRARKFRSPKYKDFFWDGFFLFSKLGPKSTPGSGILYYSQSFLLTLLAVVSVSIFIVPIAWLNLFFAVKVLLYFVHWKYSFSIK